jgi:uncharacterized protein YecE (DUF72 family)
VLGDKLGLFLVGLSPAFKKDLERFDEFLSILPEQRSVFEFRHRSWFDDEVFARFRGQRELTLAMLGSQFDNNVECFTDFAHIRWHARGRNGAGYSPSELDSWARRIREISQRADVFGYWNNDAHGYAPQNCLQLTRKPASL